MKQNDHHAYAMGVRMLMLAPLQVAATSLGQLHRQEHRKRHSISPARHQETLEAPPQASLCPPILPAPAVDVTVLLVPGATALGIPEGVTTTGLSRTTPTHGLNHPLSCGLPQACGGCGCWVWAQTCCPF